MNRIRTGIALFLALSAALLISACGGGGGNGEDPQQVLQSTATNLPQIKSGLANLDVKLDVKGGTSEGNDEIKIGGPFQGGTGAIPQFKLDADLKGEGGDQSISFSGGLISTGDAAFVTYKDTNYAIPQELFDRFTTTFTQLQDQSKGQGRGILASLVDPANFSDLKNEGTATVEGADTIHISGKLNTTRLIAFLKTIAQSQGASAQQVSQIDQLNSDLKSATFDFFTGKDDKLLRKVEAHLDLEPQANTPGAPDSVTFDLEFTLSEVNQPQTIAKPSKAEPIQSLLSQLPIPPSILGGKSGNLPQGGIGSALPQSGGSTTAPSNTASQAYLQCLSQASGSAAVQKCASLLGQ